MPDRTDKVDRLNEETGQYELPYISKSRVTQWIKNPEHFRLKYLEGYRAEETSAMDRGSRIHETFEHYYNQCLEADEHLPWSADAALPEDRELWADFIEPYISHFFLFEERRWETSGGVTEDYLPIAVEEEAWRDAILGLDAEPEWMGLADVIVPAKSIEQEPGDDGVVIIDFKTGSVPRPEYRHKGIYTELAYYEILFDEEYDVAGSAAYYPREDELLRRPDTEDHRNNVVEAVGEMVRECREYDGDGHFETKPGPLCGWSEEEGCRSAYYGICPCDWNIPVDNKDEFKHHLERGMSYEQIAELMGTTTDAVGYWKRKLDL